MRFWAYVINLNYLVVQQMPSANMSKEHGGIYLEINEIKEAIGDKVFIWHHCTSCKYPCGYFFDGEELYHDAGCNCTNTQLIEPRDSDELIELIHENEWDLDYVKENLMEKNDGHKSPDHLEIFKEMWYNNHSPTVWCEIYAHPLHRRNPVVLNYETLPSPYKNALKDFPEHKGKTGDKVHLTPEKCFECVRNLRNGGVCDPV